MAQKPELSIIAQWAAIAWAYSAAAMTLSLDFYKMMGYYSGQYVGTNVDINLLKELEKSGVKYNAEDIVMITKTPDGKLLWLEKGNATSGLQHIKSSHSADFLAKGVNDIPSFLKQVLQNTPINSGIGAKGPYAVYNVNGNTYTVAYGSNGYVVSFYPSMH